MKKYKARLEGHIKKDKGNVLDLDDYAVKFLKPKRETCKNLNERNSSLSQQVEKLSDENNALRNEIHNMKILSEHLSLSNAEFDEKLEKYISENALLMQERDNLKSKLVEEQNKTVMARFNEESEKKKYHQAEKTWNDEKSELTAEISDLNMRLLTANEQIADLTAKLQEKAAKNNGIKGLFGK
ncbi:hypothetical protein [Huintestinicola sp.]